MLLQRTFMPLATMLLALHSLLGAGEKPTQRSEGLVPKGSCAVCGMQVANFPDWAGMVSFKDGRQAWFDGPKDMLTYLLDLKRYDPKRSPSDIATVQVKDYYALTLRDGWKAFYVIGSDVLGPMGKELIPFATEADAKAFLKDHRGKRVLTFQEITRDVMKGLE